MVSWFHPAELGRAGVKAVLSQLFGAYADNREIQALRQGLPTDDPSVPPHIDHSSFDYSGEESLWFDYVADLGDGWDPTYAIAQLLAAPAVTVSTSNGPVKTCRGQFLVMGGDQVYPTATQEEYRNRLEGPYRSALPWVDPAEVPPNLFAIPGNHDWYDGLTSFTRLFCQGRWIGGWRTCQSRSYFALKLPHDWWLWGIDVQLGSDIDEPQLRYFRNLGSSISPGAKIILCVAEPTWVRTDRGGLEAYDNLAYFEAETIRRFGHAHAVGLAGDLHTYARYRSEDGRQRFISGGGGAYLYPTHRLPDRLVIPTGKATERPRATEPFGLGRHGDSAPERGRRVGEAAEAQECALYPPPRRSFELALRSLFFAWYNPVFSAFMGAYYLILVWLVESTSKAVALSVAEADGVCSRGRTFLESGLHGFLPMLTELGDTLPNAPSVAVAIALLAGGLIAFADARSYARVALGVGHTVMHVAAWLGVTCLVLRVQFSWLARPLSGLGDGSGDAWHVVLFAVLVLVVGGAAAGVVWGLYFMGAHLLGRDTHSNEVLSCQSRPDYKHVLRLRVDREGLTIFPLGLDKVPEQWHYRGGMKNGESWFIPQDGGPPVHERAVLIEPPIYVKPRVE